MALLGIMEFVCLIAIPVTLVGFLVQFARKKQSKKAWGITLIAFLAIFVVCIAITPVSENENAPSEENNVQISVSEEESNKESDQESVSEEETNIQEQEKSNAEKFAENNDVSIDLAESLEKVLADMELTDKSKVGIFHYTLSDVYNWEQIKDWADGQRYSAWMNQEHIFYIYVKDDTVVGVRDAHGNIFYSE